MYNSLNALERTTRNFEKIVTGSGFKVSRIYATRGASSSASFQSQQLFFTHWIFAVIEAVPN